MGESAKEEVNDERHYHSTRFHGRDELRDRLQCSEESVGGKEAKRMSGSHLLCLKSESDPDCEDASVDSESSPLGIILTGNPFELLDVTNLFFAYRTKISIQSHGASVQAIDQTHLEQKLPLEIHRTR